MIIRILTSNSCAGSDKPMTIQASDCADCSLITWEFTDGPAGIPDPVINQVGDTCVFEVVSDFAGAFRLRGTCG